MLPRIHGKRDEDSKPSNGNTISAITGQPDWLKRGVIACMTLIVTIYGMNIVSSHQADQIKQNKWQAQQPCPPAQAAPVPMLNFDRPKNSIVDVNIGTNFSPMKMVRDNFLILIDPLMDVCNHFNAKFLKNPNVHFLCLAVANYTGVTTFRRYNSQGLSSSLAKVSEGTSHEVFKDQVTLNTVMVVEALPLFRGILNNNIAIERLKIDMQGYDLSVLRNLEPILSESPARIHNIMAECFQSIKAAGGKQIYDIDNSCDAQKMYLEGLGYTVRIEAGEEWGDVFAFKAPATSLMKESDFESVVEPGYT